MLPITFFFSLRCFLGFMSCFPRLDENIRNSKITEYLSFKNSLNLPPPSNEELSLVLDQTNGEVHLSKVGFYIYTMENPMKPVRLHLNDTDGLRKSGYRIGHKTKVLVHGFLSYLSAKMVQRIKDGLLSTSSGEVNVIAFDWSLYTLLYFHVHEKSLSAGSIIAEFIDFLVREGTALDDIHCIGHSLGAHACGFAGRKVQNGRIARISGLDPAQPGFKVRDMNSRLNANDAKFVDCIHTCDGVFGITEPICTADYYPNSGRKQPGCPWYYMGACSHIRAHELFAESIYPNHLFPSLTCSSLNFESKNCVNEGALMGYPASEKNTGILYTTTRSKYPYALNWTNGHLN